MAFVLVTSVLARKLPGSIQDFPLFNLTVRASYVFPSEIPLNSLVLPCRFPCIHSDALKSSPGILQTFQSDTHPCSPSHPQCLNVGNNIKPPPQSQGFWQAHFPLASHQISSPQDKLSEPVLFSGYTSHKIFSLKHHVRSPTHFTFTSPKSHTSKYPVSHSKQGFICGSKISIDDRSKNTRMDSLFPTIPLVSTQTPSFMAPSYFPSFQSGIQLFSPSLCPF